MKISKPFLNFLIVCFYSTFLYILVLIYIFTNFSPTKEQINTSEFRTVENVAAFFAFGGTFLWIYCIYFYYKYDKYSKGGFKIIIFPFYFLRYFYMVIWKKQRSLENTIGNNQEPVLGNTIHLETEDGQDN